MITPEATGSPPAGWVVSGVIQLSDDDAGGVRHERSDIGVPTWHKCLLGTILGTAAALTLQVSACEETHAPAQGGGTISCSASAPPTFLTSKVDDDDGDGNPFDEDYPTIDDEDDDIADHTWVKDDNGLYHLFFHSEDHGTGSHIEHYTSADLRSLDYVGVALRPDPGGWDSHGLWAPHIIRFQGTYYMFYAGTNGIGTDPNTVQRIGLATSTDLMTWVRYPVNRCPGTSGDGCVYECDEPWTTWGQGPGSFNQQCRDPFVIWDEGEERWVMFATSKSTNQYGVVTVATSSQLTEWTGAGFIDATRRLEAGSGGQPTGGQCENPHVMTVGGTYYLLFVDWKDTEDDDTVPAPRTHGQYATSTTLTADTSGSPNWTYRGYIPDPGVNAMEVQRIGTLYIMSQSIANESSADYPEHRRALRLRCVLFGSDLSFDTVNVAFPPK